MLEKKNFKDLGSIKILDDSNNLEKLHQIYWCKMKFPNRKCRTKISEVTCCIKWIIDHCILHMNFYLSNTNLSRKKQLSTNKIKQSSQH